MSTFEVYETYAGGRIKAWVKGVPVEDAAREQLENVAALPFVHSHLAVMPDDFIVLGITWNTFIGAAADLACAVWLANAVS